MATRDERQVIIDVVVNQTSTIKDLLALQQRAVELRNALAELDETTESGRAQSEAYRAELRLTNREISQQRTVVDNTIRTMEAQGGSIDELKAKLALMRAEYNRMSQAQRDAAQGQEFIAQINEVTNSLSDAENAIGDYRRNVGNYTNSIIAALGANNAFAQSLLQTATSAQGSGGVINALTKQVTLFGKTLLGLLANPIVAIIAAIVVVLMLLVKAFQRNEENATKLNAIFAKLGAMFDWLLSVLEPVAAFLVDKLVSAFESLAAAVDWVMQTLSDALAYFGADNAAQWVDNTTASIKQMTAAAEQLAKAEADLKKEQREARLVQLEYQKEAEKLRQIRDDGTKSVKERIKANDDLGKILQKQLGEEMRIAQKALEVANLRLQIEGRTSENLDKQAEALTNIADIQERITGQESEQKTNRVSLMKEATDAAYESAQKRIQSASQLTAALIKAEKDYQSEDFNIKAKYAERLFNQSQGTQRELLGIQKRYGKISANEYATQIKVLEAADLEFKNNQAKSYSDYLKSQRESLAAILTKSLDDQILSINAKYEKAVKDLDKIQKPTLTAGMSDEDYNKQLKDYENFVVNRSRIELELEKTKTKEIEDLRKSDLSKRVKEIEDSVATLYAPDLAKFSDNERKKNDVLIKSLTDQIARKKAANIDASEDEADLRAATASNYQILYNSDLIDAVNNSRLKYEARKRYLEAEARLYADNADKQKEINAELKANDKEFMTAKIESVTEWANKSLELMQGVSDLFSALEEGQTQRAEEEADARKEKIQSDYDSGLISKDEYDAAIEASDKDLDKKKAEIARKAAIREKALKVFEIGINTASALVKLWVNPGFPAAIPMSAVVGALGALQIATVLSTPLPKAARGMFISGGTHAQGGVNIEAEGGEVIINKRSASAFLPLLSAINEAGGGVPFVTSASDGGYVSRTALSQNGTDADTMQEFIKTVKNLKIYTTVEDIRRADKNYTDITDRANF